MAIAFGIGHRGAAELVHDSGRRSQIGRGDGRVWEDMQTSAGGPVACRCRVSRHLDGAGPWFSGVTRRRRPHQGSGDGGGGNGGGGDRRSRTARSGGGDQAGVGGIMAHRKHCAWACCPVLHRKDHCRDHRLTRAIWLQLRPSAQHACRPDSAGMFAIARGVRWACAHSITPAISITIASASSRRPTLLPGEGIQQCEQRFEHDHPVRVSGSGGWRGSRMRCRGSRPPLPHGADRPEPTPLRRRMAAGVTDEGHRHQQQGQAAGSDAGQQRPVMADRSGLRASQRLLPIEYSAHENSAPNAHSRPIRRCRHGGQMLGHQRFPANQSHAEHAQAQRRQQLPQRHRPARARQRG